MTIAIDGTKAVPVPIRRESLQGSVLGCMLYCVTTQSLTERQPQNPERVYFPQDGTDDEGMEMWTNGVTQDPAVEAFLYVDDTTLMDAVPMSGAMGHITTGLTEELLSGLRLEASLSDLERGAADIGMAINRKKTQLLVISPPNGCNTRALIRVGDKEIHFQPKLKLVGFTFCKKPDASAHIDQIKERFRLRVWMLFHLREAAIQTVLLLPPDSD